MRYIIKYDREGCIGAGVCEAVDEENWKVEGPKADLIGGKLNDANFWEKEIGEDELQSAIEAAEGCPVRVIHIYNKETGERVV